jgi:hypothetical protein
MAIDLDTNKSMACELIRSGAVVRGELKVDRLFASGGQAPLRMHETGRLNGARDEMAAMTQNLRRLRLR